MGEGGRFILVLEKPGFRGILAIVGQSLLGRRFTKILIHQHEGKVLGKGIMKALARSKVVEPFDHEMTPQVMTRAAQLTWSATESVYRELEALGDISRAMEVFFADNSAILVLKKDLSAWIEERLRVFLGLLALAQEEDAQVVFVPADIADAAVFARLQREDLLGPLSPPVVVSVNAFGRLQSRLKLFAFRLLALLFPLVKSVELLVKRGARLRCLEKRSYKVAFHNAWGVKIAGPGFRNALFCVDGEKIRREDLLALLTRKGPGQPQRAEYEAAGIDAVDPKALKVPLPYLVGDLSPRLWRSCLRVGFSRKTALHWKMIKLALRIVHRAVGWELIGQHYSIGVLLNTEEHSFPHIIETMVMNRYGAKTMWLPHSQLLREGSPSLYFHYDLFASGGWYLPTAYGQSWSPRMQIVTVGIPSNDQARLRDEELAAPQVIDRVKALKERYQLVVAFPGSFRGHRFIHRYVALLEVLGKILDGWRDTCVLLKPKGPSQIQVLYTSPLRGLIEERTAGGRFVVLDPTWGNNRWLAQYLMRVSDLCISTSAWNAPTGGAWAEALMLGKPSFAYNPQAMFDISLLEEWKGISIFEEENRLLAAVGEVLEGRWTMTEAMRERLRHLFDPYCDGAATMRIVDEIVKLCD